MCAVGNLDKRHIGCAELLHGIVGIFGVEEKHQWVFSAVIELCRGFGFEIVNVVIGNGINETLICPVVECFFERIVQGQMEAFCNGNISSGRGNFGRIFLREIIGGRFVKLIDVVVGKQNPR